MAFEKIPSIALSLITKFGKTITYVASVTGTYDNATGANTVTTTTSTIKGLIEEYPDTLRMLGAKLNEGDAVEDTDRKLTVAATALAVAPALGDTVTIDGVGYSVNTVGVQYAAESVAYYVLRIRKA